MAIENTVSSDFYPGLSIVKKVFDRRISGAINLDKDFDNSLDLNSRWIFQL